MAISGKDEAFIAKFNELVPREIERINRLSTDLLHYSRPIEPNFEHMDINKILEDTARFLEVQARKKNIKIILKLSKVPEIKADREKLVGAFTNLILNAVEAMSKGEITLSTCEKDDKVVVEVADNGPGISEENMKKIFVPFFTTKKEGTGMGLAIVQRIIADHGGTIDLKSTHGAGTQFFLSFPQKPQLVNL
jgi:signal transduction histidine kinase